VATRDPGTATQVHLRRLWLTDFRSYDDADVEIAPGVTVVVGANGHGKTNLLEAIGYVGTARSFRGAPAEVLVKVGAERAVVRADIDQAGREVLVEAEIAAGGRSRLQLNKQKLRRARDLLGQLPTTVFTPEDLAMVKGGPAERRTYLDDVLVLLKPKNDALRSDVDRILRQRNALLKQAGGRLTPDIERTLDVWDAKFAESGERLARARATLTVELAPLVAQACGQLAGYESSTGMTISTTYDAPWIEAGLREALLARRSDELRRGLTLVGPHRDDLVIMLNGLPARTHASQGEQRTVALALRLAAHRLATTRLTSPPVLLLDDVFSELDPQRSDALLAHLPSGGGGQTVLTTAGAIPAGTSPDLILDVDQSKILPRS